MPPGFASVWLDATSPVAAETIAVVIGALAGVLPARQAAALDPVEALRTE